MGNSGPRMSQLALQPSQFQLSHFVLVRIVVSGPFVDSLALEESQCSLLQLVPHPCQPHGMLPLVFGSRNLDLLHLRSLELYRVPVDRLGSRCLCILEIRALLAGKCFWMSGSVCWDQDTALSYEVRARWARAGDPGIAQGAWSREQGHRRFDSRAPSWWHPLISALYTLCLGLQ